MDIGNVKIIFKAKVGSQAYGTNVEGSDIDYKGVYIQPIYDVAGFGYKPQIEVDKDTTYYEIRRFLELAQKANPTILELLFSPEDCIEILEPEFKAVMDHRSMFITKQCFGSFAGYANQQIAKAFSLDKKMNWEKDRVERKDVMDFCYIGHNAKSIKLKDWLKLNEYDPEFIGLVGLDHMADSYGVYYDYVGKYVRDKNPTIPRGEIVDAAGFKGIQSSDGNQLLTSSVPKYMQAEPVTLYFNKSEFSKHCAEYLSYQTWQKERNTQRYIDTENHGQKIDGKNMLHCRRLIDVATEIATTGNLIVRRENAEYLKSIRKGKVQLQKLLEDSKKDVDALKSLFDNSTLPDNCDVNEVDRLLKAVRRMDDKSSKVRCACLSMPNPIISIPRPVPYVISEPNDHEG